MLGVLSRAVCPACEARWLWQTAQLPRVSPSWTQERLASSMRKQKPSRMRLSSRIGQKTVDRSPRRKAGSPFGGMNLKQTDLGARLTPQSRRSTLQRPPSGDARPFERNSRSFEQRTRTIERKARPSEQRARPAERNVRPLKQNGRPTVPGERSFERGVRPAEQERDLRKTQRLVPSKARGKDSQDEPFKALKMQQALDSISYGKRAAIKDKIADIDSFDKFPLLPVVRDSIGSQALKGLVDIQPTSIQRLTIPALLRNMSQPPRKRERTEYEGPEMETFLMAAETGSGKTLAYLIPVINSIKIAESEEKQADREGLPLSSKQDRQEQLLSPFALPSPTASVSAASPKAIILLPTSELVAQVASVVKSLSHTIKLRTASISTAHSATVIRNRIFNETGLDVLVSTPHLLSSIAEADSDVLLNVQHLIVDEADSLFDRSFAPLTSEIVNRSSSTLRQLILCSATIPRTLENYIRKKYPHAARLVTPHVHAVPRRVQLGVVDCVKTPYQGNKKMACATTIRNIAKESEGREAAVRHIAVFVNERETADLVAEYLVKDGIDAAAFSRDSDRRNSTTVDWLASFMTREADQPTVRVPKEDVASTNLNFQPLRRDPNKRPNRALANVKVLVMTDLGSRGIDTLAVRHVILYDVPHTTVDFLHRLGRTGRMNRRGKGIVLVGRGDRADVVREVRESMYKGLPLI